MSYYLIVDDEPDISDLIEMTLTTQFQIQIQIANSGKEAIDIINAKGTPELIISDYNMPNGDGYFLYSTLQSKNITCPFIICSSDSEDELKKKFPNIYGYIEKPNIFDPLLEIISSFVLKDNLIFSNKNSHIPVRIELLHRMSQIPNDIYLKLNDEKFVKVINKGDSFLQEELERFNSKRISHLYIHQSDCDQFLKAFQDNLESITSAKKINLDSKFSISFESLEIVERLSYVLGWTPQVIGAAKKSIQLAIGVISSNPNIFKFFQKKPTNQNKTYLQHSAPLAMISCVLCYQLGWTSDSTHLKLAMAALMHDMGVDDFYYSNINSWNQLARSSKEKSPMLERYKSHPSQAAQLSRTIKNLPPDVDQIILQHHEAPNSSGFPRSLSSSFISPMSALFIIAEDLLEFIGEEKEDILKKLFDFVISREKIYIEGSFKRVFQALKHHISVDNQ